MNDTIMCVVLLLPVLPVVPITVKLTRDKRLLARRVTSGDEPERAQVDTTTPLQLPFADPPCLHLTLPLCLEAAELKGDV